MEREVLNGADQIVVTSATTKKEFETLTSKPIEVITNGYDVGPAVEYSLDRNFTISHIGSLLTGRNPINLWKTLSRLASEDPVFRADLQLEFMGVVSKDVMDSMYKNELGPYIKMRGYGTHTDAQRRQRQSQVLLLVEIDSQETKGIIPGKLFEYMAAKRPILAIGPKDWEVGQLIEETNSGVVFDYQDKDVLRNQILKWYAEFKKNSLVCPSKNIEQYSRQNLTAHLAQLL